MAERITKFGIRGEVEKYAKKCGVEEAYLLTGGRKIGKYSNDPVINEYLRQEEYAKTKYETIRNSKPTEVAEIAKHTGFSEEDVMNIRNHVFMEKHESDKGSMHFDVDPEIAHAWERLSRGIGTEEDILLLHHEKMELELMRNKEYNYEKAHLLADKKYPGISWTDSEIQKDIDKRIEALLRS